MGANTRPRRLQALDPLVGILRRWGYPIRSLLVMGLFVGCTRGSGLPDAGPRSTGSTLILGTSAEPSTLDPAFAGRSAHQEVLALLFRGLTRFDERGEVVPELAQSLPVVHRTDSAIDVQWTLRPGLRWSDGAALTAADLVFGHRIESDATLEAVSHHVALQVGGIDVVDSRVVRVRWRHPYADYLAPRVHAVLPAHAYPRQDRARPFRGMGRRPVSNGPYRLVAWESGARMVLEANPYWVPASSIPRIIVRFFPSSEAFEAELKTGRLDALGEASGLDLDQASTLATQLSKSHAVHFRPSGLWLHLACRLDDPVVGQVAFRRALEAAIDRVSLAKLVYGGRAVPAYGLFPPFHPAHEPVGNPHTQIDRARALFAEVAASGRDRALTLEFGAGSGAAARAAAALRGQLELLGLHLRLRPVPFSILADRMRKREHAPLTLFAYRIRPDWDGRSLLHTHGRQNHGGLSDPELDRLLDQAEREMDRTRWRARVREIAARYRAVLPAIPLLFREAVSIRPRRLGGWQPTGTSTPVTATAEDWRWVDEPTKAVVP